MNLQTLISQAETVARDAALVAGSVCALCTTLAHLPFVPTRLQNFFARLGVASGKFAVYQSPKTPPGQTGQTP